MLRKYVFISVGVLFFMFTQLQGKSFFHAKFDTFLVTFAHRGDFNYPAAKVSPRLLRDYIDVLEALAPNEFEKWSAAEQTVFWMNAYNATVIQGVLVHYPLDWGNLVLQARFPKNSIYQIKKFHDRVFIKIMGQQWTLKRIQSEIITAQFQDPRLFFTLVTGRSSDPPLRERAYSAQKLEWQLNHQMQEVMSDENYVEIRREEKKLALAPVFEEFQRFIEPPPGWQVIEENRRDSLQQIQYDSVRQILSELVQEAFRHGKAAFYQNKEHSLTNLKGNINKIDREKKEIAQELKSLHNAQKQISTGERSKFEADSLIQHFELRLDSLQVAEKMYRDSLKIVQQSEIDSLAFIRENSDNLLTEKLGELPAVPMLKLSHYPQNQQGIVALIMQYAPDSTQFFIRRNHPEIEFLPANNELNEIVY